MDERTNQNKINMKKLIASLLFVCSSLVSYSQCSFVTVQVSASDTSLVQLYHAGFFLIPSGFDNICEWKVTSFSGDIIHQDTTFGLAAEQSFSTFTHNLPITDSMEVTILITNETEGITCTMNDTLYWEETEILPGSIIGDWTVLSSNGGFEEEITTITKLPEQQNIFLYPSPTINYFLVEGKQDTYSFTIFDANGIALKDYQNIQKGEEVDLSGFSSGIYWVQFRDKTNHNISVQKLVKL